MPRSISTAWLPSRQTATALVSALLGLAALMAMSPAIASADSNTTCDPGEFCLALGYHLSGGLYQNKGNDPNLSDNVFIPTAFRVARNSYSAYNHGTPNRNGLNDVIVYDLPNYRGNDACVTLGRLLKDLIAPIGDCRNQIMSFKWARHRECVATGVLQ